MVNAPRLSLAVTIIAATVSAASLAAAGVGGVGGVTAPNQSLSLPQWCPTGSPALTPASIKAILKRRGYYAIRGLRYQKSVPDDWDGHIKVRGGRYVATASRGFGIVRWQVSVDPCNARVAIGRSPTVTRTH